MARPTSTGSRDVIVRGAATGAAAYLLGYLITYVWASGAATEAFRGINNLSQILDLRPIQAWKAAGWLLYDAHFARTRIPGLGGSSTMSPIEALGDGGFVALYVLVPVLIIVAGVAATNGRGDTPANAVMRGAAVAIGYLPLAVIGVLVTVYRIPGLEARIGTNLVTGIVLAGLVYPLLFGAIGGVLAWLVWGQLGGGQSRSRRSSRL